MALCASALSIVMCDRTNVNLKVQHERFEYLGVCFIVCIKLFYVKWKIYNSNFKRLAKKVVSMCMCKLFLVNIVLGKN